jgi:hypothetical protein
LLNTVVRGKHLKEQKVILYRIEKGDLTFRKYYKKLNSKTVGSNAPERQRCQGFKNL